MADALGPSGRFRRRLVGRTRDVSFVRSALNQGRGVVTLTGIGGIGKTCLALEIVDTTDARRSLVVGLGQARNANDVVAALARRLPWPEEASDTASLTDVLRALGPMLLVLDEVERVVDVVANLVRDWGMACRDLQVLCTSRLPLGVPGESVVLLDRLAPDDALELLVLCATEHDHRFDTQFQSAELRALTEQLDGIPLAIESASGWLAVLSPGQLVDQLASHPLPVAYKTHLPVRHRSMEASLELSWSLLSPAERSLLMQAAVLRVGFRFEEAASLFELPEGESIVEILDRLRSRGLVRVLDVHSRRRFTLLETIRQFCLAKLEPTIRTAVEDRRARIYLERFASLLTTHGLCEAITKGVDETNMDEVPHLEIVMQREATPVPDRVRAAICIVMLVSRAGHISTLMAALEQVKGLRDAVSSDLLARVDVAMAMARRFIGSCPALVSPERIEDSDLLQIWRVQRAKVLPGECPDLLDAAQTACGPSTALVVRELVSSTAQFYRAFAMPFPEAQQVWLRESKMAAERGLTRLFYRLQYSRAQALMLMGSPERAWSVVESIQAANDVPNDLALNLVPLGIRLSMMNGDFEAADRLLCILRFDLDAASSRQWGISLVKLELLRALVRGEWAEARVIADRFQCSESADHAVSYSGFLAQVGLLSMIEGNYEEALTQMTHAEQLVAPTRVGRFAAPSAKLLVAVAYALLDQHDDARAQASDGASLLHEDSAHWSNTTVAVYSAVVGVLLSSNHGDWRALEQLLDLLVDLRARSTDIGMWDRLARFALPGTAVPEPPNGWTESPQPYPVLMAMEGLVRQHLSRRPPGLTLVLHPNLIWARVGLREPIDLSRRHVGRRLLEALVREYRETNGVVSVDEMLAAGWPGDRSSRKALMSRLWVALSTLRRLGFERVIEREGDGYRVSSIVRIVYEDEPGA